MRRPNPHAPSVSALLGSALPASTAAGLVEERALPVVRDEGLARDAARAVLEDRGLALGLALQRFALRRAAAADLLLNLPARGRKATTDLNAPAQLGVRAPRRRPFFSSRLLVGGQKFRAKEHAPRRPPGPRQRSRISGPGSRAAQASCLGAIVPNDPVWPSRGTQNGSGRANRNPTAPKDTDFAGCASRAHRMADHTGCAERVQRYIAATRAA